MEEESPPPVPCRGCLPVVEEAGPAEPGALVVAVEGPQLEGAWPLSCGQHTPGGRPNISRSGPARE